MSLKKTSLGFLEGWLSIGINTTLFVLKLWAGLRTGSVAMVADAWHTISDSLTSVVVIIGFWVSAKPADEKHSFGHGRAEAVGSIIIGTLLGIVGLNFLKDSILRLWVHKSAKYSLFAVVIFVASAVIKEALAKFSIWAGKKTDSRSLVADGWHHRSDAVASGLIVIGALLGKYFWWMDGVLGIGVSVLILYATYTIIRGASSCLIGEAPSASLESQISKTILSVDSSLENVHHLHVHSYGGHMEVTAHIQLPGEMSIEQAHEVAEKVEKVFREELKAEITVHVDPCVKKK